jgi:hypothetical protein
MAATHVNFVECIFPPLRAAFQSQKKQTLDGAFLPLSHFASREEAQNPYSADPTLSEWMRRCQTVADIALESWTVADLAL